MPYKVFLVEDEIVTREGIRDNVNWGECGFQLCGEAPDGEIALSLLEAAHPDVLITDIRMPFMDGLQLSRIARERLPAMKIVILSGHDEFEYAQAAIKLSVTEYLLKPVSVQDLHAVLRRLAGQIERERQEEEALQKLHAQVEESRAALRESLFLKLVMGTISTAEAIEGGQALGVDLVARWWQVALVQSRCSEDTPQHTRRRSLQPIVAAAAGGNPDVFVLTKSPLEVVLILKGQEPEYVQEEVAYLLAAIRQAAQSAGCALAIGLGTPRPHLRELYQSFVEAISDVQSQGSARTGRAGTGSTVAARADRTELLQVDQAAVQHYLRYGVKEEFDAFFAALVRPLGNGRGQSPLIKNYLLMSIVVATAQFVHDLGGEVAHIVPDLGAIEEMMTVIRNVDEIKEPARRILLAALALRDSNLNKPYAAMMRQVKQYLAQHYQDPDLSLQTVAGHINLSPNHFSVVFGQEAGTTFKSYLTAIRMDKAKELLRTTTLRPSDIAAQIGYNDPHYFSHVFRKHTGLTPSEYRSQPTGA